MTLWGVSFVKRQGLYLSHSISISRSFLVSRYNTYYKFAIVIILILLNETFSNKKKKIRKSKKQNENFANYVITYFLIKTFIFRANYIKVGKS